MKAYIGIRNLPPYRSDAFVSGLKAAGHAVKVCAPLSYDADTLYVSWNRYSKHHDICTRVEAAGGKVIICENGYLGREWRGSHWYAISEGQHNGAGSFSVGGPERWAAWNIPLSPWRDTGEHVLILPQRGIGPPGVAMPRDWVSSVKARLRTSRPIVIREHPGERPVTRALADDLHNAHCCVTWGSGAALKALVAGVPVFHDMPEWIGAPAAALFTGDVEAPWMGDRLPMFERLAWAMWSVEEIAAGMPFRSF